MKWRREAARGGGGRERGSARSSLRSAEPPPAPRAPGAAARPLLREDHLPTHLASGQVGHLHPCRLPPQRSRGPRGLQSQGRAEDPPAPSGEPLCNKSRARRRGPDPPGTVRAGPLGSQPAGCLQPSFARQASPAGWWLFLDPREGWIPREPRLACRQRRLGALMKTKCAAGSAPVFSLQAGAGAPASQWDCRGGSVLSGGWWGVQMEAWGGGAASRWGGGWQALGGGGDHEVSSALLPHLPHFWGARGSLGYLLKICRRLNCEEMRVWWRKEADRCGVGFRAGRRGLVGTPVLLSLELAGCRGLVPHLAGWLWAK